jgi:6-pyruvoyltetrahydropterin/6-carboxytetrahydropterin synthase
MTLWRARRFLSREATARGRRTRMYQVTQELPFCYGHRLLHYDGKCGRLHGHNGVASITLRRDALDAQGMVVDFDAIARDVKAWIDATLDHRLLLHQDDPAVPALQAIHEPLCVVPFNPTAENIAKLIFDRAAAAGLPVVQVQLVEVPGSVATYSK